MILTTSQACYKLGISAAKILKMAKNGYLNDIGKNKEGKTRHSARFESREINEFKEKYERVGRCGWQLRKIIDVGPKLEKQVAQLIEKPYPPAPTSPTSPEGIMSKLNPYDELRARPALSRLRDAIESAEQLLSKPRPAPTPPPSIMSKLSTIEAKLDTIIALWK